MAATDPAEFIAYRAQIEAAGGIDTEVIAARYRDWGAADLRDWFAAARNRLLSVFAGLDPALRVPWFGPAMSVASAVTARLMETWAHGQDIADASASSGRPACGSGTSRTSASRRARSATPTRPPGPRHPVRVELTGPSGELWTWGPPGAPDRITGPALGFCLLVTQRRHLTDAGLDIQGAAAAEWMAIAQAFAGPPGPGRAPGQFRALAPGER